MLKREEILAVIDLKFEEVAVPEWNGTVRVGTMSGAARDVYEQRLYGARVKEGDQLIMHNVRALLVAYTAVDENGALLFTEADVEALGKKSAAALDRVFEAASLLNGINPKAKDAIAGN